MKKINVFLLIIIVFGSLFVVSGCFDKKSSSILVNFESFGEIIYSEKIIDYEIKYVPNNLTRHGYVFNGWFFDEDFIQPFNKNLLAQYEQVEDNESITIYANWSTIKYSITYDLNGGNNNINNPSTYTIESATFDILQPYREGFEFIGWTINKASSPQLSFSINSGSTGNISITANWQYLIYNSSDYIFYTQNQNLWGTSVKLMNNISLSGITCLSIGIKDTPFSATFDGNNYTITDIGVNVSDYCGVFGNIYNAKILNLTIDRFHTGSYVKNYYLGCLIGQSKNATVENCSISGYIYSSFQHTGGLIGNSQETDIINCKSSINITVSSPGSYFYCGGLIGYAESSNIQKSYFDSTITANAIYSGYIGGIIGYGENLNINQCYTLNKIHAKVKSNNASAGGIAGQLEKSNILNCYSTSQITAISENSYSTSGNAYAGGLVGTAYNISIDNSYYSGSVLSFAKEYAHSCYSGGFIGYSTTISIKNSFVAGTVESVSEHGLSTAVAGRDVGEWSSGSYKNFFIDSNQTVSSTCHNSYGKISYSIGSLVNKNQIILHISENWDSSIWDINNENYPTLAVFNK